MFSFKQSIDQVKKELSKLIGANPFEAVEVDGSSALAGASSSLATAAIAPASSSTEAAKPKPSDISHLIKRKKPDTIEPTSAEPAVKRMSAEK